MGSIQVAEKILLSPAGITEQKIESILGQILTRNIDQADCYFQVTHHESWTLEDGIIKDGSYNIDRGVGVRAVSGEKTGFAYSDDIILPAIEQAAVAARSIAQNNGDMKIKVAHAVVAPELYPAIDPLGTLTEQEKIDLLRRLDAEARQLDPRVKRVIVSLHGVYEVVLIVSSDGQLASDIRPLVRLNVNVIVEGKNGRRESGNAGGGARADYHYFLQDGRASFYVKEAVRQALINLDAVPAPAGLMPVVLGPGWPGVLLHEAVGHGLEGDFNRKGSSVYSGMIGQKIAADCCTIVDDGTLPGRRGSLTVDDEGTPSECTVLIENGILKGYMLDKMNARLMGMKSTGNGRRESYSSLPMPRMTNTYMLAGNHDPEEIIKSVKKGIYAANFAGGQVDITSGKFVFSASEAYLIENGKITTPIRGATLIGSGVEVLNKVSMLGNDLQLDTGVGSCGKGGQSVPVGVGQPTVKLDELTVGGTDLG